MVVTGLQMATGCIQNGAQKRKSSIMSQNTFIKHNIVDMVEKSLLEKLATVSEQLAGCAGKSMATAIHIILAKHCTGDARNLKCYNPPDIPGGGHPLSLDDSIWV